MIKKKRNPICNEKSGIMRLISVLLFAILFGISFMAVFSYGQPWDEQEEVGIFFSNMREYAVQAGLEDRISWFFEKYPVPRISESVEMDHGMAAYYALFPVYLMARLTAGAAMYVWHSYTFCIFFSGVIAVYLILRNLFSKPLIWFGGTLSYYLTPRFFAEGHYNSIDLVFVSFMLWMLYFLIRASRTMAWRYLVPYCFASAFLMNCRISGIAVWALGIFFVMVYQIIRRKRGIVYGKIAVSFFLSFLIYYALTPASWGRPVQFLQYCLENATHYSMWDHVVLFKGHMMQPAKNGLPYSYLPVWILITIPEHVLLLFALSCAVYGIRLMKRVSARFRNRPLPALSDSDFFAGMILLFFWLPFIYLVCKSHTLVLYNGWRHCYFLYVPVILHFMYVFESVPGDSVHSGFKAKKLLLCGVLVVGLTSVTMDMIHYHPYEYVYFNRLGRSLFSTDGFEGDYWNVSTLGTLRHFEDECYHGEKLKVALMVDAGMGQTESLLNSEKIQVVDEPEADYYLFNYSALHNRSVLDGYEPVSWIERRGSVISGIYVKKPE